MEQDPFFTDSSGKASSQWQQHMILHSNRRVSILEMSTKVAWVTGLVWTQITMVWFLACMSSKMLFQVMAAVGLVITVGTHERPVVMVATDVLSQEKSASGGESAHGA